jgi:hypothetical protein
VRTRSQRRDTCDPSKLGTDGPSNTEQLTEIAEVESRCIADVPVASCINIGDVAERNTLQLPAAWLQEDCQATGDSQRQQEDGKILEPLQPISSIHHI